MQKIMQKSKKYNIFTYIILLIFLFMSIIKLLFIGLESDEGYAVALAHKILSGNVLLKDCYEVYQLPSLITSTFLRLKYLFVNTYTYDVLYLRIIGLIAQCFVSFCVYKTIQKSKGKNVAFLTSLLVFTFLPKYSFIPDYALLQYWCLILIACLFIKNEWNNRNYIKLGLLAGFLTFAYPPFIIFGLSLVFIFKKDIYKVWLSTLPTLLLFVTGSSGIDLSSWHNLFLDKAHTFNILTAISIHYPSVNHLLVLPIIYVLIFPLLNKKYGKKLNNIVMTIVMIGLLIDGFLTTIVFDNKQGFSAYWLILIGLLLILKTKVDKIYLVFLIIPAIQFCVSNVGNMNFCTYMMPFVLLMLYEFDNTEYIQSVVIIASILICIMSNVMITGNFYEKVDSLHKIEDGSIKGVYVDNILFDKIAEVKKLYNNENETIFIMDSNPILYDYVSEKLLTPSIANTPIYDESYIHYFDEYGYPDKIYYVFENNIFYVESEMRQVITDLYDAEYKSDNAYILTRKEGKK